MSPHKSPSLAHNLLIPIRKFCATSIINISPCIKTIQVSSHTQYMKINEIYTSCYSVTKEMNRIRSIHMTSLTFNQFSEVLVRYRRRPKICRQARRRSLGSSKSYFSPLLSKRYWVSSSLSSVIPWIYSSGTIAADIWTVVE
jgi:hypothetical protein